MRCYKILIIRGIMKQNDVVYIPKHDSIGIITGKIFGMKDMYEVQMSDIFYVNFRKCDLIKICNFYAN